MLGVDSDGLENHQRKPREDAAAEGDQHVVDEELARESNEVHAAGHLAPAGARIRDAHREPKRHRQMQRRKRFGGAELDVAVLGERIDVGEDSPGDECRRQPAERTGVELPLPGEVAGQER